MGVERKLESANAASELEHLGRSRKALRQMVRVPQRTSHSATRVGRRFGVVEARRDRRGLRAQLGHPLALRGVVERAAQPVEQPHPVRAQAPVVRLQRALKHPDQLVVDDPRLLDVALRGADRGAGEAIAVAQLLGERGRFPKRAARELSLTAPQPLLAEQQRQRAAALERV